MEQGTTRTQEHLPIVTSSELEWSRFYGLLEKKK
jgi:hypothetical protein